ncbi:unnamed protein product [Cylindrotheca closterium]|uniref:MalT-like TPR region domain-containing protein n=1 Tax=Cylindrotheca closterium TaxID=2856 RepID=A0AAD2JGL3_9STRA|nr:unnamed protein product [Cylindrotheca closterium]
MKLGETHADTVKTFKDIGDVFFEEKNFEKAEGMYRKALDIMDDLPPDSADLMHVSQPLMVSLQIQGKLSEAIKIQKDVLSKLLQMHGEDHFQVATIYIGIANLLEDQNRLDDALQMLEKSIETCSRLQGMEDFDRTILGLSLDTKARLLQKQGDFEGAIEILNNVVVIYKETLGEMNLSTADAYETLSKAYLEQEMMDSCINAITKTLEIRRNLLGDDHPSTLQLLVTVEVLKRDKVAKALNEQGLTMKAQGDSDKAIQFFQEALDIYMKTFADHPSAITVYENLSAVKVEQGLLEDGIAASAEALKILRRSRGDDHDATKIRMDAHRSLLKRLLENRSYCDGPRYIFKRGKNAKVLNEQGLAMKAQGDSEKAIQFFQEAVDVYNETYSMPIIPV